LPSGFVIERVCSFPPVTFTTTGVIGDMSEVPAAGMVVMVGAPAARLGLTEEVVLVAVLLAVRGFAAADIAAADIAAADIAAFDDGVLCDDGAVGSLGGLAVTELPAGDTGAIGAAAATVAGTVTVTVAESAPDEHAVKVMAAPARAAPIRRNRVREFIRMIFLLQLWCLLSAAGAEGPQDRPSGCDIGGSTGPARSLRTTSP